MAPINGPSMLGDAWRSSEKFRFLAVGLWNTFFAYLAFSILYLILLNQIHYLVISVMSHVLAVTNAFICQRWLVFRVAGGMGCGRFCGSIWCNSWCLIWCLAGLAFMVEILHVHPLLSQSLIIAVAVAGSYVLNRNYSFRM